MGTLKADVAESFQVGVQGSSLSSISHLEIAGPRVLGCKGMESMESLRSGSVRMTYDKRHASLIHYHTVAEGNCNITRPSRVSAARSPSSRSWDRRT